MARSRALTAQICASRAEIAPVTGGGSVLCATEVALFDGPRSDEDLRTHIEKESLLSDCLGRCGRIDDDQRQPLAQGQRRANAVDLLPPSAARRDAAGGFLADTDLESARRRLEANFFGPMRVTQALAPVLARNGGGAVLNMLSIASWINRPMLGVYGATKSAAWALTNGLRQELRSQGTQVVGLHMGFVDTISPEASRC